MTQASTVWFRLSQWFGKGMIRMIKIMEIIGDIIMNMIIKAMIRAVIIHFETCFSGLNPGRVGLNIMDSLSLLGKCYQSFFTIGTDHL